MRKFVHGERKAGANVRSKVSVPCGRTGKTHGAERMIELKSEQTRPWTRPQLVRLGQIENVAGSNAGNQEANASGAIVRS